jgi:hypothetical protein
MIFVEHCSLSFGNLMRLCVFGIWNCVKKDLNCVKKDICDCVYLEFPLRFGNLFRFGIFLVD